MRPSQDKDVPMLTDTANRLSALSIVIDDFDSLPSDKSTNPSPPLQSNLEIYPSKEEQKEISTDCYQPVIRPYTRQSSDASIRKILEEAEHRKHEFWKLLEEHNAVIENLKRIEQLENNVVCTPKLPSTPPIIS